MRGHGVEQFLVVGAVEVQFGVQRLALADRFSDVDACVLDQLHQLGPRRRRLQVLDDLGLDTVVPQQLQSLTRGRAAGIVIDDRISQVMLTRRKGLSQNHCRTLREWCWRAAARWTVPSTAGTACPRRSAVCW